MAVILTCFEVSGEVLRANRHCNVTETFQRPPPHGVHLGLSVEQQGEEQRANCLQCATWIREKRRGQKRSGERSRGASLISTHVHVVEHEGIVQCRIDSPCIQKIK